MNVDPDTNWQRWQPTADEPWDLRRVWHLWRRAGFGATWGELQRDLWDGVDASVDRMLTGESRSDGIPDGFDEMADVIGGAAVAARHPERLKAWWLYRMLFSPDPLGERLALMWHNHFATSNAKVDDVVLMHQQNEIFRAHGRSTFDELLPRVVKHPALLVWLDAEANRKDHPNENLARELMELFTLGVGNYSESDIKEAARALTGWTVVNGQFREFSQYHDEGTKTILGHMGNTAGDDLLDILLSHPATARRIAWRICDAFMGEDAVSAVALDELAEGLHNRGLDLGWAIETVLRSRAFFAEANIGNRVLGPIEFTIGAVRALELSDPPPSTFLLAEQVSRLGQAPFYPPNVFGWDGGRTWINARSLVGRGNLAVALVEGRLRSPEHPFDALDLARRHKVPDNLEALCGFFLQLLTGAGADAQFADSIIAVATAEADADDRVARRMVSAILGSPRAQIG